jgi:hypothetical protein
MDMGALLTICLSRCVCPADSQLRHPAHPAGQAKEPRRKAFDRVLVPRCPEQLRNFRLRRGYRSVLVRNDLSAIPRDLNPQRPFQRRPPSRPGVFTVRYDLGSFPTSADREPNVEHCDVRIAAQGTAVTKFS